MTIIKSPLKPNYRPRSTIEAWFNGGSDYAEMPDWVRAHYDGRPELPKPFRRAGQYALRDGDGYFWKWMKAEEFNQSYERITP